MLSVSLSAAPLAVKAQEDFKWQTLLQLDNDLFSGSDRDYTNGVRIGFIQEIPLDSNAGQRINRRIREGSEKLSQYSLQSFRIPEDANLRFAKGFGLTQLMFTPENSFALRAPEGERPYAGWLGLEYSLHVKADNFVNSVTWSLGTTGEASQAQNSQNWVHRNISNSPIFQGWDSQVPSELTLNIHFDHKQRFRRLSRASGSGLEVDGYYEAGMAAGNFRTDAYLGGLARIGYRLPSSFSTPRVQLGSYGHRLFADSKDYGKKFSAYAFAGVRATGVVHDITLDGPVFRKFETGVESKPFVGASILMSMGMMMLSPLIISLPFKIMLFVLVDGWALVHRHVGHQLLRLGALHGCMTPDSVMTVGRQAMEVTMLLAAPILLASLAVGLIIAMFQAATQINEMTLSFVPKLMVVAVVMMAVRPLDAPPDNRVHPPKLVENIPYMLG